jgi:hypothetical protein
VGSGSRSSHATGQNMRILDVDSHLHVTTDLSPHCGSSCHLGLIFKTLSAGECIVGQHGALGPFEQ